MTYAASRRPVSGLGRGDTKLDRLPVAHLSDENDIWVLTQRGLQRIRKALRVGADFALIDEALLVGMRKLDRVFDREAAGR